MKVTLDLDKLLSEGKITQLEYDKFSAFAAGSTASLAFNILIGFGVIAVSGAALALIPTPTTAIVVGLITLVAGLVLLRGGAAQWALLANIFILVGALLSGGGIIVAAKGHLASILAVTAIFSVAGIFARSTLLAVLATLYVIRQRRRENRLFSRQLFSRHSRTHHYHYPFQPVGHRPLSVIEKAVIRP
jgi:hypothetical protein